ncbi:3-oxoacyl-[acyl-carrier-protein] synthase III C-terminal domain-containing protein [Streptomyces olivaceus]
MSLTCLGPPPRLGHQRASAWSDAWFGQRPDTETRRRAEPSPSRSQPRADGSRSRLPRERAPVTVDRPGNTGSAGLFTALHSALAEGALLPRDTYVPAGIGAGFQWGSLCLRHA